MMLQDSLIQDCQGKPIPQTHKSISMDWDKIKSWSDQVYMPYCAQPLIQVCTPYRSQI